MLNRPAVALIFAITALSSESMAQEASSVDSVTSAVANSVHSLKTVEQEVEQLKERVFRSKATLQLLRELVVEEASLGSKVILWHENALSSAYRVESVQYYLDGETVFTQGDGQGDTSSREEMMILDRSTPPGKHIVQVQSTLRGNGYGVFSYLNSYTFQLQSSYSFQVEDGQVTVVRVALDDQGGLLRSFVDRPTVTYEERFEALRVE